MDISKLDEGLYGTYKMFSVRADGEKNTANGIRQVVEALTKYLKEGNLNFFTRTNESRDKIRSIDREELAVYLAEYFFQMSKLRQPENDDELVFSLKMISLGHDDAIEQMKKCLLGQQKNIGGLQADDIARMVCSKYSQLEMTQLDEQRRTVTKKIEQTIDPKYQVSNLNVNSQLVNYCREEVLDGRQIALQNEMREQKLTPRPRREYMLGDDMVAITDMGNTRDTQQDSVLMLYHPENNKYKFLMVADGMGGAVDGDKASQEIAKQMVTWFEGLPAEIFEDKNSQYLQNEWNKKLNEINENILSSAPGSGSTYVGAIVGENFTTVASIGDSRCYIYDARDHLQQVTVDDNLNFLAFKKKWDDFMKKEGRRQLTPSELRLRRSEKEKLRFKRGNNILTKCLGAGSKSPIQASFTRLKNESYKALMLFSDGVTDCLSDTQLFTVTKNTPTAKLAAKIVDQAVTSYSLKPEYGGNPEYITRIEAGKDNTSAVVFDKRRVEDKEEGSER